MSKRILWVSLLLALVLSGCSTAVKLGERDAQKEERITEIEQSEETARTNINSWAEASKSQNETIQAQAYALSNVAIAQIHANKETNLKGMDLAFQQWQEEQRAARVSWWLNVVTWIVVGVTLLGFFYLWLLVHIAKRSGAAQKHQVIKDYRDSYQYNYGSYRVEYPKEVQRCQEEEV